MAANNKPITILQFLDQDLTPFFDHERFQLWLRRKRAIQDAEPGRFAATFPGTTAQDLPLTVRNLLKVANLKFEVAVRENKLLAQQLEIRTTQLGGMQIQLGNAVEGWADLDAELHERDNAAQEDVTTKTALTEEVRGLKDELNEKDAQLYEMEQTLAYRDKQIEDLTAQLSVRQHPTQMPYRPNPSSVSNATVRKSSTSTEDKVSGPPNKKRARVDDRSASIPWTKTVNEGGLES